MVSGRRSWRRLPVLTVSRRRNCRARALGTNENARAVRHRDDLRTVWELPHDHAAGQDFRLHPALALRPARVWRYRHARRFRVLRIVNLNARFFPPPVLSFFVARTLLVFTCTLLVFSRTLFFACGFLIAGCAILLFRRRFGGRVFL